MNVKEESATVLRLYGLCSPSFAWNRAGGTGYGCRRYALRQRQRVLHAKNTLSLFPCLSSLYQTV